MRILFVFEILLISFLLKLIFIRLCLVNSIDQDSLKILKILVTHSVDWIDLDKFPLQNILIIQIYYHIFLQNVALATTFNAFESVLFFRIIIATFWAVIIFIIVNFIWLQFLSWHWRLARYYCTVFALLWLHPSVFLL